MLHSLLRGTVIFLHNDSKYNINLFKVGYKEIVQKLIQKSCYNCKDKTITLKNTFTSYTIAKFSIITHIPVSKGLTSALLEVFLGY